MSDHGGGVEVEDGDEISEITMASSSSAATNATTIPTASSRTSNRGVWVHAKKRKSSNLLIINRVS